MEKPLSNVEIDLNVLFFGQIGCSKWPVNPKQSVFILKNDI